MKNFARVLSTAAIYSVFVIAAMIVTTVSSTAHDSPVVEGSETLSNIQVGTSYKLVTATILDESPRVASFNSFGYYSINDPMKMRTLFSGARFPGNEYSFRSAGSNRDYPLGEFGVWVNAGWGIIYSQSHLNADPGVGMRIELGGNGQDIIVHIEMVGGNSGFDDMTVGFTNVTAK